MYLIVADSGCDIFTLEGSAFHTVPLVISTDKDSFTDDETMDVHGLIEHMLAYKGRSFTACPSTESWMNAFVQDDGTVPEELYIVTLTSGLSGTYNSANVAKELFLEEHPETKVLLIDSLSVGPEMRLILEKIRDMKAAGCSFEEVADKMKTYPASVRLFFAFKSLHNLAENGRVSKLVAAAAGVLGISVYGTASDVGQIQSLGKARGDKRVIASLLEEMKKAGYKGGKVRITHVENKDIAEKMAEAIRNLYADAEILIYGVRGLCSYYMERGGMCVSCETE